MEIIFILIFIFCLIYAAYYLNKMGLLNSSATKTIDTSIEINKKKGVDTTYSDIEETLRSGAKKYINKEYDKLGIDVLVITSSSLIDKGYLKTSDLEDPDRSNQYCSGYVEVELIGSKATYTPYVSCTKYKTNGYVKRKDI